MTQRILGKSLSSLITAYYRGFPHPMKIRLFNFMMGLIGSPKLTISYGNSYIILDIDKVPDDRVFRVGCYEPEVWNTLEKYARSGEVVWDIGAHIGIFSIRASESTKVKRVYSFEANPMTFEDLERNNDINSSRFTPMNIGVSDSNSMLLLTQSICGNTGSFSLLSDSLHKEKDAFEVNCMTIDSLVFEKKIDPPTLIKIDVEGWEANVFKGANRVLTDCPPKAIVFESRVDEKGEIQCRDILTYLKTKKYKIRRISRPSGWIGENENFIAIKQ